MEEKEFEETIDEAFEEDDISDSEDAENTDGYVELIHYRPDYSVIFNKILFILSFIPILVAIFMAYTVFTHDISSLGKGLQPASFYSNALLVDILRSKVENSTDFDMFTYNQYATAFVVLVLGIRGLMTRWGGYVGLYTLIAIFFPMLFVPYNAVGFVVVAVATLYIAIVGLIHFGLLLTKDAIKANIRFGLPGLRPLLNFIFKS